MQRILTVGWCLVTLFGISSVRAEDAGPAKDVPELQVLQHYAGTWDVVMDNAASKNESNAKWILGGRFLEQAGVMQLPDGPDIWVTTLFTFDTQTQKYRSWTFVSNGSTNQAEMTWNATAKTMTSVIKPDENGVSGTVTADFSTAGKERWRFVYRDRDGQQVGEMSGVNTLRKVASTKPASTVTAKETAERSAELKQLDRFVGTWKTEYRLPKAEWTPEEKTGSATMVFTRELGGQMVRERSKHADGTENTFLMLFDANQKQYRAWWFSSTGQFNNSTGQWDEVAKAFTWKVNEPIEFTSTAQHRFVGEKLDWTVLVEDPKSVTMFRMEGSSVRDKPKP